LAYSAKFHVPNDDFFYEKGYFDHGSSAMAFIQTRFAKIGVLICYDQWFPEAARINVLKGADILFYPTAIGTTKTTPHPMGTGMKHGKQSACTAIANGVHVAAVNRVGEEGCFSFWGGSFVCDSFGQMVKRGKRHR
jgi:predicted amidohydrolase